MSCNGCRVLRKGCPENCVLRACLEWIQSPQAQGNATLFLSKFFGRSDLINFISAVPPKKRPALFQSLLFEACGRTVNPINGAVGLLSSGNWHVCQAAVNTVLAGGTLLPFTTGEFKETKQSDLKIFQEKRKTGTGSFCSGLSDSSSVKKEKDHKLLNLFV